MTPARVAIAAAAIVTALLLQATLVGPVTAPWPVSLPAVLVAAVACADGPSTGMSFGFAIGLVADLGSPHPAGVLALCWLVVGLAAGRIADRASVRRDAVSAAVLCGLAGAAAGLLLILLNSGALTVTGVLRGTVPTAVGDLLLAFALIPIVRRVLHADTLRARQPACAEPARGFQRG